MGFTDKTVSFSQDNLNSFMANMNEKHPLLSATLGSILEQGKVYVFGSNIGEEFLKHTRLSVHTIQELISPEVLCLKAEDIYFVQTDSAASLLELSGKTRALIVLVSDLQEIPDNLFDYKISFTDLRSLYAEFNNALSLVKNHYSPVQFSTVSPQPAVFLDRDGVVIEHIDHLYRPQDVRLTSGISEFIKRARANAYLVVIVTNQSGIGRQIFSQADYNLVNRQMLQLLADEQTFIDRVLFSPYFEKSKLALGLIRKNFRKPRAGMLLTAAHELNITLENSIIIGDRATDMMAGVLANLNCAYLFESENSAQEENKFKKWEQTCALKINTTFSIVKKFEDIELKKYL